MLVRSFISFEVVFSLEGQRQLPFLQVRLLSVGPHELPQHLRRTRILRSTGLCEGLSESLVYTDAKADIFFQHTDTLARGYTLVYP